MNKQPIHYMQTDPRWKSLPYRVRGENATVGGSGCGPTCAAMLIETIAGKTFTPIMACWWSMDHGYKALNQGTYYSYFKPQFAAFNIKCEQLNGSSIYNQPESPVHEQALRKLREGHYLIACMGQGLWTSSGHFVVVWWCEGKVYINDPASTRGERLMGDMATFRREVKYYWWIDAGELNKENEMSYETFKEYMRRYEQEQAVLPENEWAREGLDKAKRLGITDGTRPKAYATRQEVALMVAAVAEK